MSELPLLPTTVVGSHARPGWWHTCKDLVEKGEWGPDDLEELLSDAVDIAILDQERAGIDIITDGEARRLDGYVDTYYSRIEGLRPLYATRKAGPWGYDQQTRYEAVARIEAPAGLGIVREFEYLKAHTQKPTKVTCAGPLTFGSRIRPGNVYRNPVEIAEEFAHVINAELKALVAAGARFIQIDEPARGNVSGTEMARLFNLATEGVQAKLALHVCFGNRHGRARFKRSYSDYFPGLLEARADQFVLEFASREMAEIDKWREWNDGRELGAGVIDVKSFYPETPEDVAARLRKVLQYADPEKVYVNPDCGFGWNPRNMAVAKLRAMVAGTALVRRELGG
ncbi:MAG: methionine synthase [Candidatus Tectimicrobiota bacterium]|nr:MAG: methionine synthase [Candidatus Tectomicrobia bacterium]